MLLSFFQLNGAEAAHASYSASKMAAGRYQRMMQEFTGALQGGGLGTWLKKPPEPDHFDTSLLNSEHKGLECDVLERDAG